MAAEPANDAGPSVLARAVAWGGAALFVQALTYFLYTYIVTFGEIRGAAPAHTAILWDVALFTVFALHHSIFARQPVRAAVARIVPAALERSFFVWVASVLFIAVCVLWQPVPGLAWQLSGTAAWPLYVVQVVGIWITLRSATIIDIWELAGVRQLDARPPRDNDDEAPVFEARGPYGWVRHPIYLGWVLVVFAVPTMTTTRLVFAIVSSVYILLAIPFEERSLLRSSDGNYEDYAGRVRWKLIPRIY